MQREIYLKLKSSAFSLKEREKALEQKPKNIIKNYIMEEKPRLILV